MKNFQFGFKIDVGIVFLCLFSIFRSYFVALAADDTVRTSTAAVLQEQARLPCDVRSSLPKDRPVLILWYRDAAGTPIYSFDARGSSVDAGKHWSDERLLGKRAYFQLGALDFEAHSWTHQNEHSSSYRDSSHPFGGAYLELLPVLERDEAVYRCRVDFLLSPTRNTLVNFTVVVPPGPPQIFNVTDQLVGGGADGASIIGPYNEGSALVLTCNVEGGRPSPSVKWFINDKPFQTEFVRLPGAIVKSTLVLQNLERKDLHAVFECQASNFNKSTPISSTVTLDMNFQPLNVSIKNKGVPLSSGSDYELICESWGSRPPAIITWWKGGTLQMKDAQMSTSHDRNVTTSILRYYSKMTDNQKYLTCRAENPLIPGSAKEDGLQLNVYYRPVVTLQMGSNLDPKNIKEGDDVYFECHINANPEVQRVLWQHNGVDVYHNVNKGIILQNQTLVLQRIKRNAAGLYTCRAINTEGDGESNAVVLDVMYKPYCKRHHQTIYGTALHEAAIVTCEVEARPGPVTFRWTFNNTSEHVPISASAVASRDFTSVASYAPKSHLDYGTLLCWAFNEIGEQSSPCAFAIIPAGPPDSPENCSIANQTSEAIQVECSSGFNGGLPQVFYMEVYDSSTQTLYRNLSSPSPSFILHSLKPGLALLMVTYAANSKGRSRSSKLETLTLKVAEKRTSPPSLFEMTPVVALIISVVAVLLLTALVIIVAMKLRRPHEVAEGPSSPLNEGLGTLRDDKNMGRRNEQLSRYKEETPLRDVMMNGETEEVNPDVIPQEKEILTYDQFGNCKKSLSVLADQIPKAGEDGNLNPQSMNFEYENAQESQYHEIQPIYEEANSSESFSRLPKEYGTICIRRNHFSDPTQSSPRNDVRLYATLDNRSHQYSTKAVMGESPYKDCFVGDSQSEEGAIRAPSSITSVNSPSKIKIDGNDQYYYDVRSSPRAPLLGNPSESAV